MECLRSQKVYCHANPTGLWQMPQPKIVSCNRCCPYHWGVPSVVCCLSIHEPNQALGSLLGAHVANYSSVASKALKTSAMRQMHVHVSQLGCEEGRGDTHKGGLQINFELFQDSQEQRLPESAAICCPCKRQQCSTLAAGLRKNLCALAGLQDNSPAHAEHQIRNIREIFSVELHGRLLRSAVLACTFLHD